MTTIGKETIEIRSHHIQEQDITDKLMSKFNLIPMVYDHVDKEGIWWKGSKDGLMYVFYWNPLKVFITLLKRSVYFGFLPFKTSHLR